MSQVGENSRVLDHSPCQEVAAEGILERNFRRVSSKNSAMKEVDTVVPESTLNSEKIGLDRRGHRKSGYDSIFFKFLTKNKT